MKFIVSLSLFLSSLCFAGNPLQSNNLKFGSGTPGNKTVMFDRTGTVVNPQIRWNETGGYLDFSNDGVTFSQIPASASAILDSSEDIKNLGLSTSVVSNTLSIGMQTKAASSVTPASPVQISFRTTSATSAAYNLRLLTSGPSILLPNGASLGLQSGVNQYIYVYACDNAGTVVLGVGGSKTFDDGSLWSTTAISSGATDNHTLYTAASLTQVPIRLIGRIQVNEATAGTYASAAIDASAVPFENINYTASYDAQMAGTGSACSVTRQYSSLGSTWVSSSSRPSGGQCTMNVPSGLFTAAPVCTCTCFAANAICTISAVGTTSITTQVINGGGSPVDTSLTIHCTAPH